MNHLIPNERRNQIEAPTRTRLFVQVGLFSLFFRFRVGVMVFSQQLDAIFAPNQTKLKLPLRPHLPNPSGNGKATVRIERFIKKVIDAGKDHHATQLFSKR